jgi:hypothetical protein
MLQIHDKPVDLLIRPVQCSRSACTQLPFPKSRKAHHLSVVQNSAIQASYNAEMWDRGHHGSRTGMHGSRTVQPGIQKCYRVGPSWCSPPVRGTKGHHRCRDGCISTCMCLPVCPTCKHTVNVNAELACTGAYHPVDAHENSSTCKAEHNVPNLWCQCSTASRGTAISRGGKPPEHTHTYTYTTQIHIQSLAGSQVTSCTMRQASRLD